MSWNLESAPRHLLTRLLGAASVLVIAGSLASPAFAQDDAAQAPLPQGEGAAQDATPENEEGAIVVTGFRNSLTRRASAPSARTPASSTSSSRRGHRQVPRHQPRRIAAAHSRRGDRPRRRRGPQHHRARPRRRLHPRPHQRHRGAGHHRRHRQLGRQQPQPRLRLQRLRLGAVQPASPCARARRPTSTKARSARPSTCRPRGRSTINGFSHVGLGADGATTTCRSNSDPRGAFLISNTFADGTLRRAPLGRLHQAQPARGRLQHGALGQRPVVRRLVLAGRRHAR